jgi:hypothetical protein
MKKIFYIETTLNGYIIKKIPICDYNNKKDYCGELHFKLDGEEIEYYDEFAGDWEELDLFLRYGNNNHCVDYEDVLKTKSNIYLEYYKTISLGYYNDK